MPIFRRLDNSKGVSLVEVLVTLVVFLIGMMAVVRMFPGGFVTVKRSEDVTLANRLAQAEVERWKGRSSNLPAGILPWGWNPDINSYSVLPHVSPDNLRESLLPGGYYFTDANRFRRIHAEATRIPVPEPSPDWTDGSIYVLGFSPVAWTGEDPDPYPILVYGGPMKRRPLDRDAPNWGLNSYSEYAIDYDFNDYDGEAAVLYLIPAPYPREFVIKYSFWREPSPGAPLDLETVLGQSLSVGPDVDRLDIPIGPSNRLLINESGFRGIEHGSDSLHRKFQQLFVPSGSKPLWSPDDPYQYRLKDPLAGVLEFNPHGYGYQEMTARGIEPLTAYIDYNILDWHIIREERKLPDVISGPVDLDAKLTLRFIKKAGETTELDGTVYQGLAYDFGLTYSVMAVDVETGDWYSDDANSPPVPGTSRPAMFVDYKEGIVRFDPMFINVLAANPNAVSPFAGKTFRIYYRAEGDWAVQFYKSYDIYRPSDDPRFLDHQQFYFQDGVIYFPKCYGGCTVAVDYIYRLTGDVKDSTVSGEAYQLSLATGMHDLCYIDLASRIRDLNGGSGIESLRIARVYGVSVGTRVIWRDSGRGFMAGRWRKVDLQTYLTRSGG